MIAAYREPDRARGRELMVRLIESISQGVPATPTEVIMLGRTLTKRAADVLAYFDRPGTSNGPTEAINGRLELLRGSALGFRNLTNYIARSLLEAGGFRPQLHPDCEEPLSWQAWHMVSTCSHHKGSRYGTSIHESRSGGTTRFPEAS
jgi:Transposase